MAGPAAPPPAAVKAETYLLLPEPRAMGTAVSRPFADSRETVFTPTRQDADGKLHSISRGEFAKLGLGWDSYLERAQAVAERRLSTLQPELIKGENGKVAYAVYRGEDPSIACLLVAPSLAIIFKNIFGAEVWLVAPDRHSLFVFPARKEALEEFVDDLRERFEDNPFAASDEVFAVKKGAAPRVVARLSGAR
ncbi:MAG TPA: hypothetical protein VGH65_10480 [Verrucomicrobiaceae bacterium]